MRWAAKRDSNEPEIVKVLEHAGWTVVKVSDKGVPDLLCARRGVLKLLEVKDKDGALTQAQEKTFGRLAGALITVHVVRTPEEALMVVGSPVEGVLRPRCHVASCAQDVPCRVHGLAPAVHVVTSAFQREQTEAVVPKRRKKA